MKLNPELARSILLKLGLEGVPGELRIGSYSPEEISDHIRLLDHAGLVEAQDLFPLGKVGWQANYLTYEGSQFLADSRDETVWRRALAIAAAEAMPLTLEILKRALAKATAELTPASRP